jgi:hypothetical protein
MYLDKLDTRITAAFFDRNATEWRRQQSGVLRSIEDHQQANQTYLEDGVALLELAGQAHDLFMQFETVSGGSSACCLTYASGCSRNGNLRRAAHPRLRLDAGYRTTAGTGGTVTSGTCDHQAPTRKPIEGLGHGQSHSK